MPQATERVSRSAADRIAWLVALAVLVFMAVFGFQAMRWSLAGGWQWLWMLVGVPFFGVFSVLSVLAVVTRLRERRRVRVALAVLVFMAVFGFQAMRWSLAGGWQWLWMLVGVPFFGVFSVLSVLAVVTRLRERRRVRVALENMSLERGEGFRIGEPFELRLHATVPAAQESERTVAPERIAVRLVRRCVLDAADGTRSLAGECCDETIASREDARAGRVVYACELRAQSGRGDQTAQWSVELREAAGGSGEPLLVAALRLLPPR